MIKFPILLPNSCVTLDKLHNLSGSYKSKNIFVFAPRLTLGCTKGITETLQTSELDGV